VLRIREAVNDPPLVSMEYAVMPLAHREVEAERIHEPTMRASALGRWDRDAVWPAAINRGSAHLTFPPDQGIFPLTLCSLFVLMGT